MRFDHAVWDGWDWWDTMGRRFGSTNEEQVLTMATAEGWELAAATADDNRVRLYFKRPQVVQAGPPPMPHA